MSRPTRTTELQDFQDRQIGRCRLNLSHNTAAPLSTMAQLISTPDVLWQIAVKDGSGRPVMISLLSSDGEDWCREMSEEKSANGKTHIGSMGDPRLANLNMVEEGSEDYNIVCHGHSEGVEW